jgi:hypothetical protein
VNKYKLLTLSGLLLCNSPATAAVYELLKCRLSEGQTPRDVLLANQKYRDWVEKNDRVLPTAMEMVFEFYEEEREPGIFYWLVTYDDLAQLGMELHERWDLGGITEFENSENAQDPGSTCFQTRVFWGPPQQFSVK